MVDDQARAAMFVVATTLQQCALSSYLPIEDGFEDMDASTEEEIEEIEEHNEQTEADTFQAMYLGSLVLVIAATLPSPSSTSRGPYNQYQKCTQFFVVSMGWPGRQFRHEYQSESFFSVVESVLNRCAKDE